MKKFKLKFASLLLAAALIAAPQSALAADISTESMVQEPAEELPQEMSLEEKIQRYQKHSPGYRFDDSASAATLEIFNRFELQDGIYRNPKAKDTGEATLMITGDLMCQLYQQRAAFSSDGSSYMTREEVLALQEQIVPLPEGTMITASPYINGVKEPTGEKSLMTELPVIAQPQGWWSFDESFLYVRRILQQGDLVIGNLETLLSQSSPLTMQCRRLEDRPFLNSPVEFLESLDYAGFDLLTLANNHNCDAGVRGLLETLDNLDRSGFMHTGMFAEEDDQRYLIVDVNGIKVGIVSYATYFNTKDANFTKEGKDVLLNRFSQKKARRDIRAARKAGAEFVIAFMHWGKENVHTATTNQQLYALQAANAGADYIVGSHPHALQPYEIIEANYGRMVPVIYSMGNFVSCMQEDINYDSVILELKLKRNEDGQVAVDTQTLYPCTIMDNLELVNSDGTIRTLQYVVVPHADKYAPVLSGLTYASRQDLSFLKNSLARILPIFEEWLIYKE